VTGLLTWLSSLIEGGAGLALAASFLWGVASMVFSPCHLASVPLVVSFVNGQGPVTTGRALALSGAFSGGLLTTLALIGVLTAAAGRMAGDLGPWVTWAVAGLLLVTGLNLIPVGQYDGGHVAYAMWGSKAWLVARVVVIAMFAWAAILLLTGHDIGMTWALLGFLGLTMGSRHPAPLDDVAPLDPTRKRIGWAVVILLILILVPIPLTVVP